MVLNDYTCKEMYRDMSPNSQQDPNLRNGAIGASL